VRENVDVDVFQTPELDAIARLRIPGKPATDSGACRATVPSDAGPV
jgi:hypothetical protein